MIDSKLLAPEDADFLNNIAEGVFDDPIVKSSAREFLADPRHHIVVALSEGVVIGFTSAVHYIHPDKPPELWIDEVGVSPAHQGKGVGKAIMKELLQLGRQLGCVNAWVLTDRSNEAANRLYKSAGGQVVDGDAVMYEFELD